MRVLRFLGWIFLAAAFMAAAAETVAHGVSDVEGLFLSAHEVWSALAPEGLVIARYMVERDLSPALWPLLATVMNLPGWLILGLPGVALLWLCRASGKREDDDDEMEDSLFLFDALVEEANKEGYLDDLPPDGAGSMEPDYYPDDFQLPEEDEEEDVGVVLTIPPIPEDDDADEER